MINAEKPAASGELTLEDLRRQVDRQGKELLALNAILHRAAAVSVSVDVASVVLAVWHLVRPNATPTSPSQMAHGHGLMMHYLATMEARQPGILSGLRFLEIGTTRELRPEQKSTQKLAFFSELMGLSFTTVDMDSANTRAAIQILAHIAPSAKALTQKGENYLEDCTDFPDAIYLDAFDYEHPHHSPRRQQRYEAILGEQINNGACWEMHRKCAEAIAMRMPVGGVVAIDDTWLDADGGYDGKGRLATPLLLERGFSLVQKSETAVILERIER